MFKRLDETGFLNLAQDKKQRVAVYQEFSCDDLTPAMCFLILRERGEGAVLLESVIHDPERGRYSFLAFDPIAQFQVQGSEVSFSAHYENRTVTGEPLEQLRSHLDFMRCAADPHLPPLVGGAVGFLTYDAVRLFENIPDKHHRNDHLPEVLFFFHRLHIAFDHIQGRMTISIVVDIGENPRDDYKKALDEISAIYASLRHMPYPVKNPPRTVQPIEEEFDDEKFCLKILEAKEYIKKGDAFQIVLSREFSKAYEGSPFDVYRALRISNPSPFMFYLETKQFALAGASPERLVKVENGIAQTMPIAGTRPRIFGREEELEKELLDDPKEIAEHMMLVDLGRNDLGAIAQIGTVEVKELKKARRFAHVIHLVSILEAQMRDDADALDALKSVFPAGTLSGAPKIRAMEIIDELEESRRGIYGGAICSIDNQGNLDSCIAIRHALFRNGRVTVRTGAGIILDSEPEQEAAETRYKAKGVLEAIRMVEEGAI